MAGGGKPGQKSAATVAPPPAPNRTRLEIWESNYDRNQVSVPLYNAMEKAFRIQLEEMVDKRLADLRLASEMDWMLRAAV